jgi:hypothetical protein
MAAGLGVCLRRDEIDGGGAGPHRGYVDHEMFRHAAPVRREAILQSEEEQQEYQCKAQFHGARAEFSG